MCIVGEASEAESGALKIVCFFFDVVVSRSYFCKGFVSGLIYCSKVVVPNNWKYWRFLNLAVLTPTAKFNFPVKFSSCTVYWCD